MLSKHVAGIAITVAMTLAQLPVHLVCAGDETNASVSAVCASSTATLATNLSKEEVLYLLTPRHGMTAPELTANIALVHNLGERAYPALSEALGEATDPVQVREILRAMTDSRGDKKIPAEAARALLERFKGHDDPTGLAIRLSAVRALAWMARPEDREVLLRLMDDENETVRLTVLRELPRVCNEEDVARIREYDAKRKAKLDAGQAETDLTLKQVQDTIATLGTISASFHPTTATIAAWKAGSIRTPATSDPERPLP